MSCHYYLAARMYNDVNDYRFPSRWISPFNISANSKIWVYGVRLWRRVKCGAKVWVSQCRDG